ncbi:AcrR family transcriptional regulator [Sphingobium xenophagum]|uniref:AcrR family transcriptional regulator n=1 Tax=Sphingobium xenophagum TaxID=121428 RepID=A0ABU1X2D3_SPHXE|nr:TetR/AcrR family transcriptional regulator [Sphingobium xenophagum]MDR7155738.1 AcrR family transcriptional regulator [Sphingobium xenophagum]
MSTDLHSISGRERRRAERRANIISTAGRRFLQHGYYATSMSAIAAEMGGSKGTLWSYFPSKEDLFAACVESAIVSFRQDLVAILDPNQGIREALERFTLCYIEGLCRQDAIALQRLIISEGAQFPELSEIFYRQGPKATVGLLEGFIRDQMVSGNLRVDDAHVAATMVVNLCVGGLRQKVLLGVSPFSSAEAARESCIIAELFLRCYRTAHDDWSALALPKH